MLATNIIWDDFTLGRQWSYRDRKSVDRQNRSPARSRAALPTARMRGHIV
jgi:hypothetical protein